MGKRGPKPGTTYNMNPVAMQSLRVESDKELVAAQHFSDRIERLIAEMDGHTYPASRMDTRLKRRLMQTLEAVQAAVIDGIADYLLAEDRRLCARERHESTPSPGSDSSFAIAPAHRPLPPTS
ncbi:MAG: hypothetical protein H7Z41_16515 [Cytophagales bacterium]|nr:hypothetical protein [Armatimonadota bacterium]